MQTRLASLPSLLSTSISFAVWLLFNQPNHKVPAAPTETSAFEARAVRLQLTVLAILTLVFAALAMWLAPRGFRWIAPVGPIAVLITERLGNSIGQPQSRRPSTGEPILAAIAAIGIFVWPFANRETPHAATLLCLAIAVLVQAAWAIHRYAPVAPRLREPLLARVRNGVRFGLGYAIFFGLVATALSLLRGGSDGFSLPAVVAAYLIGGVLTGIAVGLGRRLNQWPIGAMLLGILAAFPAFEVISLLLPLMRADAPTLSGSERLGLSLGASVLLGPIAGLIVRVQWTDT